MKKICLIILAIVCFMCGCKNTQQSPQNASHAIGAATGVVVSQLNVDTSTIDNINHVLLRICNVIPESPDVTFVSEWTPIINSELQKMLDDGKITEQQYIVIKRVLLLCAEGVDYMFSKHTKWRQYLDVTQEAIYGFIDGYTLAINTLNSINKSYKTVAMDIDAYKYLSKKIKNL